MIFEIELGLQTGIRTSNKVGITVNDRDNEISDTEK